MTGWCVYVLFCGPDNAIYTGVTRDFRRRIQEHVDGRGAKFTRSFRPTSGRILKDGLTRSEALKEEAAFKALSRDEKLRRLQGD